MSRGVLSVAAWHVCRLVASALCAPILARLLSASGYGRYAYYLAVIFIAWPVANAGTMSTLAKYIGERPDDVGWRSALAAFAAAVNATGVLVVGSVVFLLIAPGAHLDGDGGLVVIIVMASIAIEQVAYFSRAILYGVHREELTGAPGIAASIAGAGVGVALTWLGGGLAGALTGVLTGNVVMAVGTLRQARPYLEWRAARQALGGLPFAEVLQFGLSSLLHGILALLLIRADTVLIRNLSTDTQTGLYAAAIQWSEFVSFLPLAVQAVMLQSTAPLWAAGGTEAITRMLSAMVRYVAIGTGILLLIVFAFATPILRLYFGPEFVAAMPALRILVPGMFAYSLARVMWPVIQARGRTRALVAVMAGGAAVNLALDFLLIPGWGSVGAAVASCLAYTGVFALYAWILNSLGVRAFRGFQVARFGVLCIGTLLAAMAAALWIAPDLLSVGVGALASVLVYVCGALRLGLIRWAEVIAIADSLPSAVGAAVARIVGALSPLARRLEGGPHPEASVSWAAPPSGTPGGDA
jgi:O-antigen/teichoic acid export membrane protein